MAVRDPGIDAHLLPGETLLARELFWVRFPETRRDGWVMRVAVAGFLLFGMLGLAVLAEGSSRASS